jgi:membrane-associated phospholipid phosphatase
MTPTRRLALVAAAAAGGASITYAVTVGTRAGQLVGGLILGGRTPRIEEVTAAEAVLEALSRSSLAIGTIVIVAVALVQRRPRLAGGALLAVVGANLTTQLLKQVVLDRSDLLGGLFYPLPNSFPSGHVTAAASIAVGLLLVAPSILRAPVVVLSALAVAIVGLSTLVAGWHRMADALGGAFVATSWGAGVAAILVWRLGVERVGPRTAELGRLGAGIPVVLGGLMLTLGTLAYVIVAIDPLEVLLYLAERGGSPALFGVGALITAGGSFLSLGALGFAMRDVRLDPRRVRADPGRASEATDDPPA